MSTEQKLRSFIEGLMMLCGCFVMIAWPDFGYLLVLGILSITLIVRGLSDILYYFTMARHMVGGRAILFNGVVTLDIGSFALSITHIPRLFVLAYLVVFYAMSGLRHLINGIDALRQGTRLRNRQLFRGIVNLVIAILCAVFWRRTSYVVFFYCLGLANSGILHIADAFRKTEIIHIQ